MIVQLTPNIKFVCDRCGKEEFPDENGELNVPSTVNFREFKSMVSRPKTKEGQVCTDCLAEFWEFANNFFDDVNKEREGTE